MALAMPVVLSDRHRLHDPGGEIRVGVRTAPTEVPERVERIRATLEAAGAPVVSAEPRAGELLVAVHDPGFTRETGVAE